MTNWASFFFTLMTVSLPAAVVVGDIQERYVTHSDSLEPGSSGSSEEGGGGGMNKEASALGK